jgi:cardiolipin synthase C
MRRVLNRIAVFLALLVTTLIGAHLAFRPPPLEGRTVSDAVEASMATRSAGSR